MKNKIHRYLGLQANKYDNNETIKNNNDNNSSSSNLFNRKPSDRQRLLELRSFCRNSRVLLAPAQRLLCQRNLRLVDIFARAAKLAIDECQHQFKNRRWNCSIFNRPNVFGRLTQVKSRETAFVYALNSAAAMYQVTRACTQGNLKQCSCSNVIKTADFDTAAAPKEVQNLSPIYTWGGCSDNVIFGHKMSKFFVDSNEYAEPLRARPTSRRQREMEFSSKEYKLMNLHNNEVGRRVNICI